MVDETRVATADELLRMPRGVDRWELVRGELRRMSPAGGEHGRCAARLLVRLGAFVEAHDLGETYAAETGFRIGSDPDTVRAPDVAFVRMARAAQQPAGPGFVEGAPDLAIEVLSPSDTFAEAEAKALCWLDAGCRLVWLADPSRRTVTVYRSRSDVRALRADDVLDGGDVVPGWSSEVGALFPALPA